MVMAREGDGVSSIDLTLDDEATSTLSSGQLSSGSFKPSSPLSIFDGTNPNGVWELYVDDMAGGDSGSISGGWSLAITSEGPIEPPPTDTTPPDTSFRVVPPALSSDRNPRFSFRSSESSSTFECKIDSGVFQSCPSPKQYFLFSEGQHTFQARAKDAAGNVDQTPAQHTWTLDSKGPTVTFTERPGNATGPDEYDTWVTNGRSPTWAWTMEDPHLDPDQTWCDLDEGKPNYDDNLYLEPCPSPFTFEGELPDGYYSFEAAAYDEADNYGGAYNELEVDTIAPTFVSGKPTGRRVSRYAWIKATFDDQVHGSAKSVNIYKRGSNRPLALDDLWVSGKSVELNPKGHLKPDTPYTVKVTTGVNDGANNLETPKTWKFKTR